jgi:hypothetical protein
MCACITCGVRKHVTEIHAGHFVDRQVRRTRWLLTNVHPQCASCNSFKGGAKIAYVRYLNRRYGTQILSDLLFADEMRNAASETMAVDELEELADYAEQLCRELADEKGIDLMELNWR